MHNASGRMTKVTDALSRATDYEYNQYGQMTKVISPSGGANYSTMAYDILGRVTKSTDEAGNDTTFYFDFKGNSGVTH